MTDAMFVELTGELPLPRMSHRRSGDVAGEVARLRDALVERLKKLVMSAGRGEVSQGYGNDRKVGGGVRSLRVWSSRLGGYVRAGRGDGMREKDGRVLKGMR